MNSIPRLDECTTTFTGDEAFAHAVKLYDACITKQTPSLSADIIRETEQAVFRPATELQLAGLSLLGGKDARERTLSSVPLACFAVDHLLWGWNAAVSGEVRVAYTLARAAIESSIFETAAVSAPDAFKRKWN